MNSVEQFRDAIRAAGLNPPDQIIDDGKLRRFAPNGRKHDDSAWYVLHGDGIPAGAFGDWRSDFSQTWRADIGRPLTPTEEAAQRERVRAAQRAREAEEARRHAEAAAKAASLWKAARPAGADHPYLSRKGVAPVATLREIPAEDVAAVLGYPPQARGEPLAGRLIVAPVKVRGALSTCELIDEDGRKSAIAGGAKRAGHWAAQALPEGDGSGTTLLIGEGVATALSATAATGHPAIAALSCGNLAAVGRTLRERYPRAAIVILADLGNGEASADEAAAACGGSVARPAFGPDCPAGATDFNDMATRHGLDAVRECISGAIPGPQDDDCPPDPTETPDEDPDATAGRHRRPLALQTVAELLAQPRPEWIVRGLLPRGALGVVFGEPGSGKTFLVTDLAAAIARGLPWFGRRTRRGAVVYLACEGTLRNRLEAYMATAAIPDLPGMHVRTSAVNLLDPRADTVPLIDALHEIGEPVALVVVDTLNRALAGGNENAPEDMGALIAAAKRIQEATGAAILFVHHCGKDATRGGRGHSSLKGAADLEIAVTVDDAGNRAFAATKVKDGESGAAVGFRLVPVDLGPSSDPDADPGERESSCVVAAADVARPPKARPAKLPKGSEIALSALRNAIDAHGAKLPETSAIPAGTVGVPGDAWRRRYEMLDAIDADADAQDQKRATEARKKRYTRARLALQNAGIVGAVNDRYWLNR